MATTETTALSAALASLDDGGTIRIALDRLFKQGNEKAGKYFKGEWTIRQLLENTTEDDPFMVTHFYDKLYVVHNKQDKYDIAAFLSPAVKDAIFPTQRVGNITKMDETNTNIIKTVFPEIAEWLTTLIQSLVNASCTGCEKNNYMYRLLRKIAALDNTHRDMTALVPLFGEPFVARLALLSPIAYTDVADRGLDTVRTPKAVTATPVPEQLAIYSATTTRGSSDPKSDVKELLGTAIVTLNESVTGFPAHRWLAIGYLSMAQDFAMSFNINFANILRAERLRLMKDESYIPDLLKYIEELEK